MYFYNKPLQSVHIDIFLLVNLKLYIYIFFIFFPLDLPEYQDMFLVKPGMQTTNSKRMLRELHRIEMGQRKLQISTMKIKAMNKSCITELTNSKNVM